MPEIILILKFEEITPVLVFCTFAPLTFFLRERNRAKVCCVQHYITSTGAMPSTHRAGTRLEIMIWKSRKNTCFFLMWPLTSFVTLRKAFNPSLRHSIKWKYYEGNNMEKQEEHLSHTPFKI